MKKQVKFISLIALALTVVLGACLLVGCSPKIESNSATVTGVYTGERKYGSMNAGGTAWSTVSGNILTLYSDGTYSLMTQSLTYGTADFDERGFEETVLYGTFTKAKTDGETTQYDITLSAPTRVAYQNSGKMALAMGKEFHIDTADMLESELARASKLVGEKVKTGKKVIKKVFNTETNQYEDKEVDEEVDKEYATVDEAKTAILAKYAKTRIVTVEMYELDREDKLFNRIIAIKEQ